MPLTYLISDEAALYDRQIRLWGLEAQQRSVQFISCSVCVHRLRLRLPIPSPLGP
jgi:hypothetical protein